MAIPVPDLDDRRFQQLVDDAKRLVQQRCPEWTDHNVSDPGVTLIETFAFIADAVLYRLNRVPDKLYLAFLDLIGVRPHAPTAASVDVTFWLSAPQEEDVVVGRGAQVATVRTEQDDGVSFETVRDLVVPPRTLAAVATQSIDGDLVMRGSELRERSGFRAFSDSPRIGDALLVALDDPAPWCAVALRWECEVTGVGVNPDHPPLRWEAWTRAGWRRCDTERDGTGGLNRPGHVIVHLPRDHAASVLGGVRGGWIRTVVTEPEPDYPGYASAPLIRGAAARTVGGTVPALHAEEVTDEVVGLSEGVPGQSFALARAPVVADGTPLTLEVAAGPGWRTWTEVESFADRLPEDAVFRLDRTAGTVEFPPAVREPDGGLTHYGAVPPKGAPIRVPRYRTGGGPRGNVAARSVTVLRTSVPLVERVENRHPAGGGTAAETLDQVRVRGPLDLRTRDRAVTASDIEVLALRAAPSVARVRCVAEGDCGARLLVVPQVPVASDGRLSFESLVPSETVLSEMARYLDDRRVVGTRLVIEPPAYQGLTVVARLSPRPGVDPQTLDDEAMGALFRYFNPLTGGPDGTGWPFGRSVRVGDVYAVLQRLGGTDVVEEVRLFAADPTTGMRGSASDRIAVDADALVFSFGHQVKVMDRE